MIHLLLAVIYLSFISLGLPDGLVVNGFGCAPIYPCIIHSTPAHFGADNSQALIGVQMASAYIGCVLMPPLFGVVADHLGVSCTPPICWHF